MIGGNFALILFGACIIAALVGTMARGVSTNEWTAHNLRKSGKYVTGTMLEQIEQDTARGTVGNGIVALIVFGALFVMILLGIKP